MRVARKRKAEQDAAEDIEQCILPAASADGEDASAKLSLSSESIDENANPQEELAASGEACLAASSKRSTRVSKIQRKSSRPLLADRTNQAV